jgi:hypothetical protein
MAFLSAGIFEFKELGYALTFERELPRPIPVCLVTYPEPVLSAMGS